MHIACVRAILQCSDTNASNVLYRKDDLGVELFSIDESMIFSGAKVLGQTNAKLRAAWRDDLRKGKVCVDICTSESVGCGCCIVDTGKAWI
jgi:hypothetical protein